MSELTLTLLRLGLLALLWIFIFSVVGVLRTDLYVGVAPIPAQGRARAGAPERRAAKEAKRAPAPAAAPAPARARFGRGRSKRVPQALVVTEGPDGTPCRCGAGHPHRPQPGVCAGPRRRLRSLGATTASTRPFRAGGLLVEDLGSTNGTFIGRDKLTAGAAGRGRHDPAHRQDRPSVPD